jgi:hypothetical protein
MNSLQAVYSNPSPPSSCLSAATHLPTPKLGGPAVQTRTALGITRKEAVPRISVDASMLARWERGERERTATGGGKASAVLTG